MKEWRGNLLLLVTAIIWGSAFVAQSVAADLVGTFTFQALRSLLGGLVLLPVVAGNAVMRRICTTGECAYIGSDAVRFTEVWTRKEAFSKLDGRGLSIGPLTVPTADENGLFPRVCGCAVQTAVFGDYVFSIVWKD